MLIGLTERTTGAVWAGGIDESPDDEDGTTLLHEPMRVLGDGFQPAPKGQLARVEALFLPPSAHELPEWRGAILYRLGVLERLGLIQRAPHIARGIRLMEAA